ncbi:HAD family hydrolase [Chloroflexota bacterium]
MIRAVFFDLYQTLVRYEPPREELQAKALADFGISVTPEKMRWPLVAADEFIYGELARVPLGQRDEKGKMALWAQYQRVLLKEAMIEARDNLVLGLLGKMREVKMGLVLFADVEPVLTDLRNWGMTLGLISNIDRDISATLNELGLPGLLDIMITSLEVGATKPGPQIFQAALQKARVSPGEAIYVGDQYQVDVLGANGAGMKGILLDRGNFFPNITDVPRIQGLGQVLEHL